MAFIEHQGRSICYRLIGNQKLPLLVMAHPLGMNMSVWDELITALISRFRLLTWDLPGHGSSSPWHKEQAHISPADIASEVLFLAEQCAGRDTFHFIGTSIGGVIGQELLHWHPGRLLSLYLTNTGEKIGTKANWDDRAKAILDGGTAGMAAQIVPRWFSEISINKTPGLLSGWQHTLAQCDDRSYALMCKMLGDVDYNSCALPNFPEPNNIHIIGGEKDVATPPELLRELAVKLKVTLAHIFADTGHVPSIEAPAKLLEVLTAK